MATTREEADQAGRGVTGEIGLYLERSAVARHSDMPEALRCANEALALSRQQGDRYDLARSLREVAVCRLRLGDLNVGLSYMARAMNLFRKLGETYWEAESRCRIGDVQRRHGNYGLAYASLAKALDLARQAGSPELERYALLLTGVADLSLSQYTSACDLFTYVHAAGREEGDDLSMVRASASLALLYLKIGDFEEAMRHNREGLRGYRSLGFRFEEGTMLCNSAVIHDARRENEAAINDILQSIEIMREVGNREQEGRGCALAARYFANQRKMNLALYYQRVGVQILKGIDSKASRAVALMSVGYLSMIMESNDLGERALNRAVQLSRDIQDGHVEGKCCFLLAKLYEHKDDQIRSLKFYKRYIDISSWVYDRTQIWAITDRRVESARNERKIALSERWPPGGGKDNRLPERMRVLRLDAGAGAAEPVDDGGADMVQSDEDDIDLCRKISARCPALSPSEVRVGSLLARNRSTKEIADMLSLSVHTVETHRRKIRKKLALTRDENLTSYLMGLR